MKVEDVASTGFDTRFNTFLFYIQMEGIEQQPKVVLTNALNKFKTLLSIVDKRCFVAVDRLQGEADILRPGFSCTLGDGARQPVHGLRGFHAGLHHAADQANNDQGPETSCEGHVAFDALDGPAPD